MNDSIAEFVDLGWIRRLPDWINVHLVPDEGDDRGNAPGTLVLSTGKDETLFHVACLPTSGEEFERRYLVPMLDNLLGAALCQEYSSDEVTQSHAELRSARALGFS